MRQTDRSRKPRIDIVASVLALFAAIVAIAVIVQPDPDVPTGAGATADAVAGTDAADPSWWGAISTSLAQAEYEVSETSSGFQAPNRAQNLRTSFDEQGISIVPRTTVDAAPAWMFAWETTGLGRPGQIMRVASSVPEAEGRRVTYRREGWSEWYENTAQGLEQGFTIERSPSGEGALCIEGRVPGPLEPRMGGDGAVDFLDAYGARAIRYGELHVWDARGVELPAEIQMRTSHLPDHQDGLKRREPSVIQLPTGRSPGGLESPEPVLEGALLAIVIDDSDATYPLTVDPLMTSPAWTAEGDREDALLGFSVATAGDVNGDGFSDVIAGAWGYDNGESAEGRAFVYHGSASGLSLTANWTAEGNQATALFGYSVATAGDVNGDGFSDVIVGAHLYDNGQTDEGRAFVYHGSAGGLSEDPDWTAECDQASANFGGSVGTAGDVNGDGFADVIVGSGFFDNGQSNEGRAFVYHGSAAGLSPLPDWTAESDQIGAQFGGSVATAGDVNGDGFSDVVIGSWLYTNGQSNEGGAFLYQGSPAGLSLAPDWSDEGDQANAYFGVSVAGAGDRNGDGYADVIVGAQGFSNGDSGEGRVFSYFGSTGGLGTSPWIVESNQPDSHFGGSVATAGDVNGDGYADVIVGAKDFTNGQFTEGRAFVFYGSTQPYFSPHWTAESNQVGAQFGCSVATAGDVNGDGFSDVIVGAFSYENGQRDEGGVFVYHGSAEAPHDFPDWTSGSPQADAQFGAAAVPAGDVNGDGYGDVIIGAPLFDDGQVDEGVVFLYYGSEAGPSSLHGWIAAGNESFAHFGEPISAGDVNGDGYSDLIVGATGRVFVYHGSPAGPHPIPATILESEDPFADFGCSVSGDGDINGDGYSDLLVGASEYGEEDQGAAFAYHGSASGLETSPAWMVEGGQGSARFGWSVAMAGDVNGDGFGDAIVGSPFYDDGEGDEGGAFAYHGSAAGISQVPAWSAESGQAGAEFGFSVSRAGDVNGDGFSDVVIGAPRFDDPTQDSGRAYMYHGSPSGLAAEQIWTDNEGSSVHFGNLVATAGDVNGDGFSDVLVRGIDQLLSMLAVYEGSAAGLNTSDSFWRHSHRFGPSAGAGDVNGDGFSDPIAGLPNLNEAWIFYGNEGICRTGQARQLRTDGTPISLLGRSDSPTQFSIHAELRSIYGRTLLGMEHEVKPFGQLFDGQGTVIGDVSDIGADGASEVDRLVSGLSADTQYHWRVRARYDLARTPFQPHGPWYQLPSNGANEADLRTAAGVSNVDEGVAPQSVSLLLQAPRPNPSRGATQIEYSLPADGWTKLTVHDVIGRERVVLVDRLQEAGHHRTDWDARSDGLPAGIYFLRLAAAGDVVTQRLVLSS